MLREQKVGGSIPLAQTNFKGIIKIEDLNHGQKSDTSLAKKLKAIALLGGSCSKCGIKDDVLLEFHHPDSSVKEKNINSIQKGRWSEIEKK